MSCASDPAPLGGAAAVVGDRGDVLDAGDLDPGALQRADGRLAAGAGALHLHVDLAHAVLHRAAGGLLGGHLGGERRALLRALEADVAGRGPGEDVPLLVGDRDDRVVEGALDVRHPVGDVLPLLAARATTARLRLRHYLRTFFLPATVFLGPLRVRALVWVRWPRTGRPLRWRRPCQQPISILRRMSCWTSRRRSPSTSRFWST